MPTADVLQLAHLGKEPAVYVIYRLSTERPRFLRVSPGGHFKRQDPTVPRAALVANWVERARVLYIGKADRLHRRMREYMRFGRGVPVGHWGGRLIWQLKDSAELLVAWQYVPDRRPKDVEDELIAEFRSAYSKPPFANNPHLLGN